MIAPRHSSGQAPRQGSGQAADVRGCADLVFARRGSRTVLAHSRVEAPMTVIRPFELPDGRKFVLTIFTRGQAGDLKLVPAIGRNVLTELGVTPAPTAAP